MEKFTVQEAKWINEKEFKNILNDDGLIYINYRAQDDYLYKNGKEIEKNTFLSDKHASGILYYFPSLDDIKDIFNEAGLEIICTDSYKFSYGGVRS